MKSFIELLREKYRKLEPVHCPYLGQEVFFTLKGFKHLLWKSDGRRDARTIRKRFEIIDVVPEILANSGTLQEYENSGKEFFCFVAIIKDKKYKVVITKSNDGTYKFVSVIPNWKVGKRDTQLLKNHPNG